MIILKKLYSNDNCFREINFKNGINLICGEKSLDEFGNVTNAKQNGVGKSYAVELINFCFMKKKNESKIFDVPDDVLPPESFVNLHFVVDNNDFIVSRNKKDEFIIKDINSKTKRFDGIEDAKAELEKIFNINIRGFSFRDYINFIIKEEDYIYKDFVKLYKSSYIDLIKIFFYFFEFSIDNLVNIKKLFGSKKLATENLRKIKGDLKKKNLNIEEMVAEYNQLSSNIRKIEKEFEYKELIDKVDEKNTEIVELEKNLEEFFYQKKQLLIKLNQINSFAGVFEEDFYIDDDDIYQTFAKFEDRLAEFIVNDIKSLKSFRNQLMNFKSNILNSKKDKIEKDIDIINANIDHISSQLKKYYQPILSNKKNNIVKGLRANQSDIDRSQNLRSTVTQFQKYSEIIDKSKIELTPRIEKLKEEIETYTNEIENFKETFFAIHETVMNNRRSSITITATTTLTIEQFFKFDVYIPGQGSKGVNQLRAALFDFALLTNEHTKSKHKGFFIHDNLIFGTVDKDSSINVLNFASQLNPEKFQYIATVNKDDFNYNELDPLFNFSVTKNEVIELTKDKPLFNNWHK